MTAPLGANGAPTPGSKPLRSVDVVPAVRAVLLHQTKAPEPSPRMRTEESERRFRSIADVAPLMIWLAGVDGRCTWFNARWLVFTGRAMHDELGDGWMRGVHPDDLGSCIGRHHEARAAAAPFEMEYRLRRGDGVYRWVLDHGVPVYDEAGAFAGYSGSCVDVSDRHALLEAERLARRDAERLATRLAALQAVTAALGEAYTAAAVGDVIMQHGLTTLGAARGAVMLLDESRARLTLVSSTGYSDEMRAAFGTVPVDAPLPFPECVRTERLVMRATGAGRDARDQALADDQTRDHGALAAIPLWHNERVIGALGATWLETHELDAEEEAFLVALGAQCAQALERSRLFDAAEAAQSRAEFLAGATHMLAATLDYETTLAHIARIVVPDLADWCAVDVLTDPSSDAWPPVLERVVVMHSDPERIAWAESLRARFEVRWQQRTGLPEVLRSGATQFIPRVPDDGPLTWAIEPEEVAQALARELNLSAYLCVPLRARGRTLGAITLCMAESRRQYSDADRRLAEELAQRASTALDNARLLRDAEAARSTAERANHAKAEFLAIMSHELRTPLNAIGGYAQLLELGVHGPTTDAQRNTLARIQRSQHHLLAMINEVLNYARLESAMVQYDLIDVPMRGILAAVEPLILPQAEARTIALVFDDCAEDVVVHADAEKLQQIMINLLSNAIKFTEPGGTITVTCVRQPVRAAGAAAMAVVREESPYVAIAVRDTGVGVPPEDVQRIFEPFVQLGRSRYGPGEGSGLGLAISRDLARGMGGDLSATSVVGEGSTFTVVLVEAIDDAA